MCRQVGRTIPRRHGAQSKPSAQASRPPQLVPVFQAMPLWPKSGMGWVSTSATVRAAEAGQELRPVAGGVGEQAQRAAGAVGRERGIQRGGLAQGDAVAAERQRQRRVRTVRQAKRRTGGAQCGGEAQRADAVEQRDGRQVQRAAQRLAAR